MRYPRSSAFVLVGFDGLRPDLVRPEVTPNLCRVMRVGTTLRAFRSVYPSDTRAAFPSYVTGAPTQIHGSIANRFVLRDGASLSLVDTMDAELIAQVDATTPEGFLHAPPLGEILARRGRSLAVLSTDSAGSTRILNPRATLLEQVCISGHHPSINGPADLWKLIEAAQGLPPPAPRPGQPDIAGQEYVTTAFLDAVWPRLRPDVTMLWYSEPDWSSHFCGTGAAVTLDALKACDAQLGRVFDWYDSEGREQGVHLVIASDHGHITGAQRVSVGQALTQAGFSVGPRPGPGVTAIVPVGQVGLVYLTEPSKQALQRAVDALMAQEWCGPIFTRGTGSHPEGEIAGTLAHNTVSAAHGRAPDVYFSFRADDGVDEYGLIGRTSFDNARSPGQGVHGGLHPRELAAVGVVAGNAFRQSYVSRLPCGVCDVAPTMLHVLGLPVPTSMQGRILSEALAESEAPLLQVRSEILEAGTSHFRQALRRAYCGGTMYIDGGWAGPEAVNLARSFE
jgi:Type I phosphodiesterase / nucleotide pyrophosphatase